MAEAAARAAEAESDVHVRLLSAVDAQAADVLAADGYIFATPETLAAISGLMKDFFDRTYYAALERINGRPYASLICAGSDGQNAARQIERIATGWRLRAVAEPVIVCTHAQTPEAIFASKTIDRGDLRSVRGDRSGARGGSRNGRVLRDRRRVRAGSPLSQRPAAPPPRARRNTSPRARGEGFAGERDVERAPRSAGEGSRRHLVRHRPSASPVCERLAFCEGPRRGRGEAARGRDRATLTHPNANRI